MKPVIMTALIILFIASFTIWYVTVETLPTFQVPLQRLRGAVRSKTIWFNGVALLFLNNLPNVVDYAAQNLPALQPYLPENHYSSAMGAILIANLLLRYKTTHPLELK